MNPLTHTKINLDLLRLAGIKTAQLPLVVAGGILPDLAYVGAFPARPAHEDSEGFVEYLKQNDPEMAALGVGFMLHGEQPTGLDWFTHNPKGYIAQKRESMVDIVYRHKVHLGNLDLEHTTHTLTEFACDSLVEKEPALQLNHAFNTIPVRRVAHHLSNFFKVEVKKVSRALNFLKRFDFQQLRTEKGVGKVVQNYVMIQRLGRSNWSSKHKALIERFNLRKRFRIKKTLADVRESVREDFHEFLAKSLDKMNKKLIPRISEVLQ